MEEKASVATAVASSSRCVKSGKRDQAVSFFAGRECRYAVVKQSAAKQGWKIVTEESSEKAKGNVNILWVDTATVNDFFLYIKPWQRINHFPGMTNIARKTRLAQNLEFMKKKFASQFSFFPCTFVLPKDSASFRALFSSAGRSKYTFIVKPDGGSRGRGIFLTRDWSDIEEIENLSVAQRYIRNPLLIDGKKFDLRIYVLVTSCRPLRVYLFRDGLVRIATEDFVPPRADNLEDRFMHLTNYSINKFSDKFEQDEDCEASEGAGSKRSVRWLLSWLCEEYGASQVDKLWCRIGDVCVKTILSILPTLEREYTTTFGAGACQGGSGIEQFNASHPAPFSQTRSQAATIDFSSEDASKENNEPNSPKPECEIGPNKPAAIVEGSRCFQVLGFDVMIDSRLNPKLIEVNHLPSFATDSALDEAIKSRVIDQALGCVRARGSDRRVHDASAKKMSKRRLFQTDGSSTTGASASAGASAEEPRMKASLVEGDGLPVGAKAAALATPDRPIAASTQAAEEIILSIYKEHAPEKIENIPVLLQKYRGYEEWLLSRIREKYCAVDGSLCSTQTHGQQDDHGNGIDSNTEKRQPEEQTLKREVNFPPLTKKDLHESKPADGGSSCSSGGESRGSAGDALDGDDDGRWDDSESLDPALVEEEECLHDYDRVYPPPRRRCLRPPPYRKMREYVYEEDAKQLMRLTCPLHRKRPGVEDGDDGGGPSEPTGWNDEGCRQQEWSNGPTLPPIGGGRYEGSRSAWITGDVHRRGPSDQPAKMRQPPTQKQVEAAERLSRGQCAADRVLAPGVLPGGGGGTGGGGGGDDQRLNLPSRVYRDLTDARERRKRIEDRLARRGTVGVAIKSLDLHFDFDGPQQVHGDIDSSEDRYYVDINAGRSQIHFG